MQQALSFLDNNYQFDIESLKQYALMDKLNYTYLCILLQRARFSAVKPGQRLKAAYEKENLIYLIKGRGIVQQDSDEYIIDETYKDPVFEKDSNAEVIFNDDSLLVRIERPLYEIFNKSCAFDKVLKG